jgi:uncharacterized cupin superfamily protein
MTDSRTAAIDALDVEAKIGTTYPAPFRKEVAARSKRVLGDLFGLTNYGVNLVELAPGAWSAQRHWHTREDEFVYVLSGELTLVSDEGRHVLTPGMVAGFPAGESNGHHLINTGDADASYLEIGDRISEDEVFYPDIDLQLVADGKGEHVFTHRDGKPYDVE